MGNRLPFGVRKRPHPLAIFGLTILGSVLVIGTGGLFLAQSAPEVVAGGVAPPNTARQHWYVPVAAKTLVAGDLDIARDLPVGPSTTFTGTAAEDSKGTHTVRVESLRVRSGPSRTNAQLFALKGGTRVSVGPAERGWVEIRTDDGRQGWVYSSFLLQRP